MLPAGLFLLMAQAAGGAVPPPAPTSRQTVQQLFDVATQANDRGDVKAALAGYQAIEARLGAKANAATLAIVRARLGTALLDLGRPDEAVAPLRYALAHLALTPNLRGDLYLTSSGLGRIAESGLDYAGARRDYAAAEASAEPAQKPALWAAMARVTMFEDPAAGLRWADKAWQAAQAQPDIAKPLLAQYRTIRGRAMLNGGDFAGARVELKQAMTSLGGLTAKVDSADIVARSDLAIAAMLAGDKEDARKYLAFTGAGTQKDVLQAGNDIAVPECGDASELRPDDVAVVDFSIADDGQVVDVSPVYASRAGPVALAFARAVAGWSWTKEELAPIKPFFRTHIRMELRCSVAMERPDAWRMLEADTTRWLVTRKATPYEPSTPSAPVALAAAQAELRRREAAAGPAIDLLPVLDVMIHNSALPRDEHQALVSRALAIAEAEHAPARALLPYAIRDAALRTDRSGSATTMDGLAVLRDVQSRPAIAGDGGAMAAMRLVLVDTIRRGRREAALPLLDAIVAEPSLDAQDPVRISALLRIATIRAGQGDLAGARAAYAQTGLTAQQCALVDAKPALVDRNNGSSQFPKEAMQWGFEGWAQTEFDIAADGHTANVRSIIAYPPFIFSPASIGMMKGVRFTQSYRPEGGLGCGGQTQRIRFGLPGKK